MPRVSETPLRDVEIALGKYRTALGSSHMLPDALCHRYRAASEFVRWLDGADPMGVLNNFRRHHHRAGNHSRALSQGASNPPVPDFSIWSIPLGYCPTNPSLYKSL